MGVIMAMIFIFALLENASRAYAQDDADVSRPSRPWAAVLMRHRLNARNLSRRSAGWKILIKNIPRKSRISAVLLADKDADYQKRMQELEDKLAAQQDETSKKEVAQEQSQQTTQELEAKTNEMLAKGGDMDPQDQNFREELAKAHYNMGNIYFERGEYQRAVVEYYQAVDLTPNDPDTHYNLAFVSGEYLGDQETALEALSMVFVPKA